MVVNATKKKGGSSMILLRKVIRNRYSCSVSCPSTMIYLYDGIYRNFPPAQHEEMDEEEANTEIPPAIEPTPSVVEVTEKQYVPKVPTGSTEKNDHTSAPSARASSTSKGKEREDETKGAPVSGTGRWFAFLVKRFSHECIPSSGR